MRVLKPYLNYFQEEISAKRVCSWNPNQINSFNSNVPVTPAAEINHNHLTATPTTTFTQQQPMQQVSTPFLMLEQFVNVFFERKKKLSGEL